MTEFEMIISNKKFNPETEYFFRYVKSMFVNGNEELEKNIGISKDKIMLQGGIIEILIF